MTEEWRPVPCLPGVEVSNTGRVRQDPTESKVRYPSVSPGPCGFPTVQLSKDHDQGRVYRVGVLVAETYLGPCPEGALIRHIDGDPLNDTPANLAYGTRDEITADYARRARRDEAAGAPTHCPEGHRYADSWESNWGQRACIECRREDGRRRRLRRDKTKDRRRRNRKAQLIADGHADTMREAGTRRARYLRDRDEILARQANYRAEHREERRTRNREYWAANADAINARRNARHAERSTKPTQAVCPACGATIDVPPGPGAPRKYCGRECLNRARRKAWASRSTDTEDAA